MAAAKEVAKEKIEYPVCDLYYTNDPTGCRLWSPKGEFVGLCDPLEIPDDGPRDCFIWHSESKLVPNPACSHDVVGWGTYGPWLDWESNTPYGVSRLQAEVSSCTPNSTTVFYWQIKRDESHPWSGVHFVNLGGPAYWIFQLTSGTVDGDWSGARYRIHANGPGVFPMMAGAIMEGIDRAECPTGLFL
jgi:hypothetical protein